MLLALFPLQLALFPGQELPLHIFEPRYKQLIVECRDEGITFGIPPVGDDGLSRVGTEVSLVRILETFDTGEMDIIVRGERVFWIDEFQTTVPDKLYSAGTVTFPTNDPVVDAETEKRLIERFDELERLASKDSTTPTETVENLSFLLGARVGLSLTQRIEMLRMLKESERQTFLLDHIDKTIQVLKRRRTEGTTLGRGNGNGHARHFGD